MGTGKFNAGGNPAMDLANKAGAYSGFCGMKLLGVFLLPLDEMLVHHRVIA